MRSTDGGRREEETEGEEDTEGEEGGEAFT